MQTIATFLKTPGFIFHGVDLRVRPHAVLEGKLSRLEFRIPAQGVGYLEAVGVGAKNISLPITLMRRELQLRPGAF